MEKKDATNSYFLGMKGCDDHNKKNRGCGCGCGCDRGRGGRGDCV